MDEVYNNKNKKYRHLTPIERGKIEALLEEKKSISQIAKILNRSKSTISEEVRRGKHNGKYKAHIAQKRAEKKKKESHKHTKWKNTELLNWIYLRMKNDKCSPEVISKRLENEKGIKFSHTSIYKLIRNHRTEWAKYLINKGKKKRKLTHSAGIKSIPNRIGIEERGKQVEERRRFGDWEADTVISVRGSKPCIAVFVERISRKYIVEKMEDKSAGSMLAATIRALGSRIVKTITYDNGTENANHEYANNILKCKSFFCNAYHSWEKGSIENRNKILRQFFPKGTNFDTVTEKELKQVQEKINNRPLKVLNWHTPNEVYNQYAERR